MGLALIIPVLGLIKAGPLLVLGGSGLLALAKQASQHARGFSRD